MACAANLGCPVFGGRGTKLAPAASRGWHRPLFFLYRPTRVGYIVVRNCPRSVLISEVAAMSRAACACCMVLALVPSTVRADDLEDGIRAVEADDYDSAITSLTAAIKADDQNADAYLWRGIAYAHKK